MSIDAREIGRLLYDQEMEPFVGEIQALLRDPRFAYREGASPEEQSRASYERLRLVHERFRLGAGDVYDDPRRLFALHDWLGVADGTLMTLVAIHYSLCMGSILQHGRGRDDLGDYVAELESLRTVGVFLATEHGYGNNVGRLETEAVYDLASREFVIHTPSPRARKFMPNTGLPGVPKLAVVMARLRVGNEDHGVFPFIVRIRDQQGRPCKGVHVQALGDKPVYALDNAITSFDQVRIPERNWLHGPASRLRDGVFESSVKSRSQRFLQAIDRVQLGRVALTGAAVAVLRSAVFIATRYSMQRKTFAVGKAEVPIIAYRNQQRDLFGALATAYALSFGTRYSQRAYRELDEETREPVGQVLSILKAVSSYAAMDELVRCRERVGAVGLFNENRIAVYLNQVQGIITAEGDNQLVLLKAAREMMTGLHYDLPEATDARTPEARELLDPDFHADLLRFRERCLCMELRESMRKALAEGQESFAAWNDHVNRALDLARARGERVLLEQFQRAVRDARSRESRSALERLYSLYALRLLERDSGWLLAEGALAAAQVKALPGEIDVLCGAILPDVGALVDAFGISNDWLRCPIAEDDYIAAYADSRAIGSKQRAA